MVSSYGVIARNEMCMLLFGLLSCILHGARAVVVAAAGGKRRRGKCRSSTRRRQKPLVVRDLVEKLEGALPMPHLRHFVLQRLAPLWVALRGAAPPEPQQVQLLFVHPLLPQQRRS
ncbi:hypothetical protein QOT17_25641 [Balamuthia mandrillaris]